MNTALLDEPIPANSGALFVLNETGDTRHIWTVGNKNEERAAQQVFTDLKAKGYMAYRVEGTDKGSIMRDFDASAGKMIMAPPVQGG